MVMEAMHYSTEELLKLYPEFKPVWEAANTPLTKYHVRKALVEHHEEMTR